MVSPYFFLKNWQPFLLVIHPLEPDDLFSYHLITNPTHLSFFQCRLSSVLYKFYTVSHKKIFYSGVTPWMVSPGAFSAISVPQWRHSVVQFNGIWARNMLLQSKCCGEYWRNYDFDGKRHQLEHCSSVHREGCWDIGVQLGPKVPFRNSRLATRKDGERETDRQRESEAERKRWSALALQGAFVDGTVERTIAWHSTLTKMLQRTHNTTLS